MGEMTIRLSFRNRQLTIADPEHVQHLWPSSVLSDALGDLTRGVASLLQGTDRLSVSWQDEPGEWRWLLIRHADRLSIRIVRFEETFSHRRDEEGVPIFQRACRLADFAGQLKSELQRLLDELGPEGYHKQWGRPFPCAEYETLDQLIRNRPRMATGQRHRPPDS